MSNDLKHLHRHRRSMNLVLFIFAFAMAVIGGRALYAYTTDQNVYAPANYTSFQPPAKGGSYTDAVFGTAIKRLTDSMHMVRADNGGTLATISPEYSTMTPFNQDNTRLILEHFSYFGLYDGAGNYLKDLPLQVNSSSEPRWSRTDPNVLYYHYGNQLKTLNVGTGVTSVIRTFNEYSSINGAGESDISEDGDHLVYAGDGRYVFVYEISTDTKGPVFDTAGHGGFDSLYMTPNNNVTITWFAHGTGRYQGIEMFDRNMNFLRQVAHAGGHMDVTRDTNGDEVLVWTNSADPQPISNCQNGIVKIRLADAKQTCLMQADWSLAAHVSAPDNSGWAFVEFYNPQDIIPPNGWKTYTNELLQVKLDGTEVRRLAHHRSRPLNSYTYMPKISTSRDGTKVVFGSNFGLQAQLGYPTEYSDAYMIDVSVASPSTGGTSNSGTSTGGSTSGGSTSGGSSSGSTSDGTTSGGGTTSNGSSSGSGTSATSGRVEENISSVAYTGGWYNITNSVLSGGSAIQAMDAGARATFTFSGTAANWIGYSDEWSGIANVYVDGLLKETIDTYATPFIPQRNQYSVAGLASGSHTLSIEVTGTRSSASAGSWVWVDAFESTSDGSTSTTTTTPTPVPPDPTGTAYRVEQSSSAVKFSGLWSNNNLSVLSGGSAKLSMDAGAKVTFSFTGTSITWIGYRDMWSGMANVYIDGVLKATVDTYSATDQARVQLYDATALAWGAHTITIQPTGTRSAPSKGTWVWVDAFDYAGAALTATSTDSSTTTAPAVMAGGSSAVSPGAGTLQVGYAEIASAGTAPAGVAILDYRKNGILVSEAGVPGADSIRKGRLPVEISGPVNTGFAIANPNDSTASIAFYFTDRSGSTSSSGTMTLPPHGQIAKFLDEAPFSAARPTNGTFTFSSDIPVAALAIRGYTNERSEFLITTLPIAEPDVFTPATFYFPHYAWGGGWSTQFVLVNPTDEPITGTLDFHNSVEINGQLQSSIPYTIAPRTSINLTTSSTDIQVHDGSAMINPAVDNSAPAGIAVFSYTRNGVRVSEAGIPLQNPAKAFRMYAESSSSVRTGMAVMNSGDVAEQVSFEVTTLNGAATGLSGTLQIAAGEKRSLFLNEIPGFGSLPGSFQGILRVSAADNGEIVVLGLRGRWNERNDFLMTTTPAVNETQAPQAVLIFPHIVDGAGYTTQFITFSATPDEPAAGNLQLYSQSGSSMTLTLH